MRTLSRLMRILVGLVLLLAAGCIAHQENPLLAPPQFSLPDSATRIVTMLPVRTATGEKSAFVATSPQSTVKPTQFMQPTLENGGDVPGLHVALTPDAPRGAAWRNCQLAVGWIGCVPDAPKLAARLAFYVPSGPLVAVLDLETNNAWSVTSAANSNDDRIRWSPGAEEVLVALSERQYVSYRADGTPSGLFPVDEDFQLPTWQPDGVLAAPDHVRSAQGDEAWLEQTSDTGWQVVWRAGSLSDLKRYRLETVPSDRLFHLVSFVPGANQLLAQQYYAGNQVMMQGAQLLTLNLEDGNVVTLDAMAPLGWRADFAWQTLGDAGGSSNLAFTDTGGPQVGLATLALINFANGKLERPLPAGVMVAGIDWRPTENQVAFAAQQIGDAPSPGSDARRFSKPGIYLLSVESGTIQVLTQPPSGALDGLPTWTSDGKWLLYARAFEQNALEVHAVQPESGQDWVIAAGLTIECNEEGLACPWARWLDMQTK